MLVSCGQRTVRLETHYIGGDLSTLRVTSKNDLRVWTPLGILGHLDNTSNSAVVSTLTVEICVESAVDQVLLAAACQAITNGLHQESLTSRVRLIVSTSQEDLGVFADTARRRVALSAHGGGEVEGKCAGQRRGCFGKHYVLRWNLSVCICIKFVKPEKTTVGVSKDAECLSSTWHGGGKDTIAVEEGDLLEPNLYESGGCRAELPSAPKGGLTCATHSSSRTVAAIVIRLCFANILGQILGPYPLPVMSLACSFQKGPLHAERRHCTARGFLANDRL